MFIILLGDERGGLFYVLCGVGHGDTAAGSGEHGKIIGRIAGGNTVFRLDAEMAAGF